ncbi:MAG: OB-fold domain-containing protein [Thermodesulfobacteriota bacterium]|nr:OB-fold domain-containing protein [Thermodesulfobacteriota bacterium]
MVGIVSYGAYIPKWRMPLDLIAKGARGERTVAGPDEDSITMAVAAVLDCLKGVDKTQVEGLFFASTTSPFSEKQVATLIAKAVDLSDDIMTVDFSGSLKCGTTAMKLAADTVKAGSAKQVLVVASDCRLGEPGSEHERNGGDGAAAFLIAGENVKVSFESSVSVSNEIFDVWRRSVDIFVNSWESRFDLMAGYNKSMKEAVAKLMKNNDMTAKDFSKAVFYCPDARSPMALAKGLGFDPKVQLQDPFFGNLGNTGAASPLLLLVAALENAVIGDNILVAGYGNGSDAIWFKVKNGAGIAKNQLGVKGLLESKLMVPDYFTYLTWRGLVAGKNPRVPSAVTNASAPPIYREREKILSLYASKCKACGSIEYPPQRICAKCQSKDDYEEISLAEKKGKIFTSSNDPITGQMLGLVNFEGGGRIFCNLTDGDLSELKIDAPVEMSFRKLDLLPGDTIRSYVWKAVPARNNV